MAEWDIVADYYDLLFSDRIVDIPFWVKLSKRFGSPILELACGNGRITFPIAKARIEVTGIDISGKMLDKGKEKLARQPKEIQDRIKFIKVDINSFQIPSKKFKAVFSPWGFFPITDEDQKNSLKSVKDHLLPNGYFVVDIRNSKEPTKDWSFYEVEEFKSFPTKGFKLMRQAYLKGSAKTKIGHIIFFLDKIENDGTMKRFVTERDQRVYAKTDMENLLNQNGFRIIEIYGDYDFGSYTSESERVIFVSQPI